VPRRDQVVQGVEPTAHSTSHGGPPATIAQQHAAVASDLPNAALYDIACVARHTSKMQVWCRKDYTTDLKRLQKQIPNSSKVEEPQAKWRPYCLGKPATPSEALSLDNSTFVNV